jgi:hypothetical protein
MNVLTLRIHGEWNRIHAIKATRIILGWGLKQSKLAVERHGANILKDSFDLHFVCDTAAAGRAFMLALNNGLSRTCEVVKCTPLSHTTAIHQYEDEVGSVQIERSSRYQP